MSFSPDKETWYPPKSRVCCLTPGYLKIYTAKKKKERERDKQQTGGTLAMVYKQLIVLTDKDLLLINKGFPGGSDGKESACNVEDPCSIPGSGRSPGEGIGNPFQYSFLENPMDRGAWRAIVNGVV